MKFTFGLFAVLLGVAAAIPLSTPNAGDCDRATGGQAGLNDCFGKVFKKADAELNKLYKEIRARLKDDADTTRLLVATQKAWISYRDAECAFQATGGGSIAGLAYPICQAALTRSRIKDFKGYLKCQEGDTNCPVPAAN